jgi:drug/metabolite transporter (DMT)-like permease
MGTQGRVVFSGGWYYAAIAYTAVLPSFVAYLLFNRGVELIGAGRAGQSMHLMPPFGSILAVLFLHEAFQRYHAFGIAVVAAGILLASVGRCRAARCVPVPPQRDLVEAGECLIGACIART